MAALPGGDVAVRHAEETDVAMPAIVQALHQHPDRSFIIIADGGDARRVAGQQHQRLSPRCEHLLLDAGKTKQHHAVDIAPGEHAEMLLDQRRGELALHHNRIVALSVKGGKHGLYGEVFRQRIQTGDDDRHHFIALAAHRPGGT